MAKNIFCTAFCNQGHYLNSGRPVGHECYTIPPKFLHLERQGREWNEDRDGSLERWLRDRVVVRGRAANA
jgi:hypothetical protein